MKIRGFKKVALISALLVGFMSQTVFAGTSVTSRPSTSTTTRSTSTSISRPSTSTTVKPSTSTTTTSGYKSGSFSSSTTTTKPSSSSTTTSKSSSGFSLFSKPSTSGSNTTSTVTRSANATTSSNGRTIYDSAYTRGSNYYYGSSPYASDNFWYHMWLFNSLNHHTVMVNGSSGYIDGSGYFHAYSIWSTIGSVFVIIIIIIIIVAIIRAIIRRRYY